MKKAILSMAILVSSLGFAQTVSQDTTATKNRQMNAAQNILSGNGSQNGITIVDMHKLIITNQKVIMVKWTCID
jgi:hypothetical protein